MEWVKCQGKQKFLLRQLLLLENKFKNRAQKCVEDMHYLTSKKLERLFHNLRTILIN